MTQLKRIETAKVAKSNMVYIFNGVEPQQLNLDGKMRWTATNFLPFVQDQAAFVYLNHKNFFATTKLSGCDVWIADAERKEPVVIHINVKKWVRWRASTKFGVQGSLGTKNLNPSGPSISVCSTCFLWFCKRQGLSYISWRNRKLLEWF